MISIKETNGRFTVSFGENSPQFQATLEQDTLKEISKLRLFREASHRHSKYKLVHSLGVSQNAPVQQLRNMYYLILDLFKRLMPLKTLDEKIWILPLSERFEEYVTKYCQRTQKDLEVLTKAFNFLRLKGGQMTSVDHVNRLIELESEIAHFNANL